MLIQHYDLVTWGCHEYGSLLVDGGANIAARSVTVIQLQQPSAGYYPQSSLYTHQSGTLPFSVALRELPYTVTLFDRATKNGSSGHLKLPKMPTFLPSNCCY